MTNKEIAEWYLFIDLAIKNMELDMRHVKNGPFKIKDPYLQLIEKTISKAINKRRKLKQLMRQNKIQVLFLHTQGHFTTYKFILGRNEHEMVFNNMVIKKNVEEVIRKLM